MKQRSTRFIISILLALSCIIFVCPTNSNAQSRSYIIKRGKHGVGGRARVYGQQCDLTVQPKSTPKQLIVTCKGSHKHASRSSDLGLVYLSAGEELKLTGENCFPETTSVSKNVVNILCRKRANSPVNTPTPSATPVQTSTPTLTPTPTANLTFLTANVVTLLTNNSVLFQVLNQSATVTALNIQATLPTSWTDVTQSPFPNCASVAPGGVCTIQITAGNTAHAQADVPLKGSNTNVALTQIDIIEATTLSSSVSSLTVSVNDPGLNAALTGTPRQITITNTGSTNALSVNYSPSPPLPSGSTISPANCGNIAPSASCTLTITPGNTASSTPGDTNPTPISLSISGSNTNVLTPDLQIVTYGSVYQGGYIFSVDDTTVNTGSIGGKVAALTDASNAADWGGFGTNVGASTNDTSSSGSNDGASNTATIVTALGAGSYAAALCAASSAGGFTDWYLPAICEMTPYGGICTAGSTNIQQQLFDASPSIGGIADGSSYWSSTQFSGSPSNLALFQFFGSSGGSATFGDLKSSTFPIRCVRQIN